MTSRRWLAFVVIVVLLWTAWLFAATLKYSYPAETTYLQTDGYGGATADLSNDGFYDYGADIDLETNGYYGVWVFLEHDSSGTTDDIIISYFGSYDGTNFDDVELWSATAESDGSSEQLSWLIYPAPPHGRIGVKTNGSTDTFDYQITYLPFRGDGT